MTTGPIIASWTHADQNSADYADILAVKQDRWILDEGHKSPFSKGATDNSCMN